MEYCIICIKKADGDHEDVYTAISSLNWIKDGETIVYTSARIQMYDFVKAGGKAYVKDNAGNKAYLLAETTSKGTQYVRTRPDGTTSDNLLNLPECK